MWKGPLAYGHPIPTKIRATSSTSPREGNGIAPPLNGLVERDGAGSSVPGMV